MRYLLRRSFMTTVCLLAICSTFPAITGCGSSGDCFDTLFDDLDDADDNEEIGEAWDDFFECVDD